MTVASLLRGHDLMLAEGAIVEALENDDTVALHDTLLNAPLIYTEDGRQALEALWRRYIDIAQSADRPILLGSPTWRADPDRIAAAGLDRNLNADAVDFVRKVRESYGEWGSNILLAGLMGVKNDAYQPGDALDAATAAEYHSRQADWLAEAGVDLLQAATLPAVGEATGMARAMAQTGQPYIVSFVINRRGRVLDGTPLGTAIDQVDQACTPVPVGYMINCAHPDFLGPSALPPALWHRLIGLQGNASAMDHDQLEATPGHHEDDLTAWGEAMLALRRRLGLTILGGCCGTTPAHIAYLAEHA
ncbi:MAG: homocysteine S-methyltransferase family protein [Desulfosarcinaceae bacterium]|nr:homocysteine S-methyltransferase family protein [Desulfosarcinaceae bacterium]